MRYITLTPSNVGSANPLAGLVFCDWMKVKVILSAHRNPSYHYSLIAQLAEHGAVNSGVPGSSPGGGACPCSSVVEQRFCKPLVASSNLVGGS